MGLIKAAIGTLQGTLADTWKEAFHCGTLDNKTLLKVGTKMHADSDRTSNTKGTDNYISNGSMIMVEENTCMLTIDNGKITNVVTEPGAYKLDNSSAPSIFAGDIKQSALELINRFTYGGVPSTEQKVVYINLQKIPGIKFGTTSPMPYFDPHYNTPVELRCFGTYEIQIPDAEAAVKFYSEVCPKGINTGDVSVASVFANEQYTNEFMQALMAGLNALSNKGVMYARIQQEIPALVVETSAATVNNWQTRGFTITNIGFGGPVTLSDESKKLLSERQLADTQLDVNVQRAMMNRSVAKGIEAMGANEGSGGGLMGVMGMNAMMGMGSNIMNSYGTPQQTQPMNNQPMGGQPAANAWKCSCGVENTGNFCTICGNKKPEAPASWTCACGATNTTNFCSNCGTKKGAEAPAPAPSLNWTCSCGATNTTKFCANCGAQKPAAPKKYKCDKCGWTPADPEKPPKFCPECGDLFDENDIQ